MITKNIFGHYKIKIKNKELYICACINCGEIHAITYLNQIKEANKIKCCNHPDNQIKTKGSINRIIKKLI